MSKYLIHIGICGFGNQLLGFKEACIIAKYTGRKIVQPIFIPHGTIRNECNKYYDFKDIFDVNIFNSHVDSVYFKDIPDVQIRNIYNMRPQKEEYLTNSYYDIQNDYYKFYNVNFQNINKKYITSIDCLHELKSINDEVLVLLGTFNNVILTNCYKNGCLNKQCLPNKTFIEDYNFITKSLSFNNNIMQISYYVLQSLNIDINNLCVFHMRVLDLCENKSFEYAYNNYNEENVYISICNYLKNTQNENLVKNIFLIAPPQYETINNLKFFNTNLVKRIKHNDFVYDRFILSLVELFISEKSKVFVYSPTNSPNIVKQHTRSSFTLHTKTLREMSNIDKYDINISEIYK